MFTVFTVITLEGWSLMMMNYSDAGQPIVSPIFFILVVILGAFFALNLVLAEVMESFERSKESEEGSPDELDPEKVESTQVPAAQNDVDI
jgi:Na+/phosphate symporter